MVEEYCNNCGSYVKIQNELKVQVCPICGRFIVPCNLCPLTDDEHNNASTCELCPLERLCKSMNNEIDKSIGVEKYLYKFEEEYNKLSLHEKECGFYLTDSHNINEKLYLHYDKENNMCILVNTNGGKAYTWVGDKIGTNTSLFYAVYNILGELLETMFINTK